MPGPGRSLRRARGGSLPEREGSTPTADAPTDGLIRAQRMDAAARTTRALAHELANYLGAMRSTLYLLADDAPDDPAVREDLEVLARAHGQVPVTSLVVERRGRQIVAVLISFVGT